MTETSEQSWRRWYAMVACFLPYDTFGGAGCEVRSTAKLLWTLTPTLSRPPAKRQGPVVLGGFAPGTNSRGRLRKQPRPN